jgi:hypothetical protein
VAEPLKIGVIGIGRDEIVRMLESAPGVQPVPTSDIDAATRVQAGELDYVVGVCESGGGAALAIPIAILGADRCRNLSKLGRPAPRAELVAALEAGVVSFGLARDHIPALVPELIDALASSGRSFYHDALRPLARDFRDGKTSRAELARYSFGVSYGFVLFFALPFAVLTGAVVSHLIFLPADVIGVRLRSAAAAFVAAGLVGAGAVVGVAAAATALGDLPLTITGQLSKLVEPVLWLYPALPLVAALKLPRRALGAASVIAAGGAVAGGLALLGAENASAMGGALAGTAALVLVRVLVTLRGPRTRVPELAIRPRQIYRALPLLLLVGAAAALLAQGHRLAGDPLAAILIGGGHELDAAAIALITAAAFFPLVAVSSVTADSYSTQGTPDWILAAGYLLPSAVVAAAVGAVMMAVEVTAASRSIRSVLELPVLSEVAAALREATGDVGLLAVLVGGLSLAGAVAGPLGFLAVGGAWLVNESLGRPLWRIALAPSAAIVAGLVANAWHVLT